MKQDEQKMVKDRDVLGMDKPSNQLKSVKIKKGPWFLMIAIIIIMIGAALAFYFK